MASNLKYIKRNRQKARTALIAERPIEAFGRISENICYSLIKNGRVDPKDQHEFLKIVQKIDLNILLKQCSSQIAYARRLSDHTDLNTLEIDLLYTLVTSVLAKSILFRIFDIDGVIDVADLTWFRVSVLNRTDLSNAERRIRKANPLYVGLGDLLDEYTGYLNKPSPPP